MRLTLLILGGGSMWCPNVGAKFRSQCLSHFDAQFGWGFPLKQGDDYAQLDWMDLEGKK